MRHTTKEALAEAFEGLLEKRSIDKITVKDIVTECGVNRQTFYYHFRDIYDLMEWALVKVIETYAGPNFSVDKDWQEQIKQLFHLFYLHRTVLLHGYDATNRMQYERVVIKWVTQMMRGRIDTYPQAAQVPEEKGSPRCLRKLYQVTREGLERHVALLVEQAQDRLLEEENLSTGWEE